MLNWLRRLRGRDSRIDDATLAYIEGKADEATGRRVRDGLGASYARGQSEVEGLKATVSLLHAVGPIRAPRSFALSPAVADAARTRRGATHRLRPWYVQAPAMAAAAAVLAVGVLVLGDIAGALRQSTGEQPDQAIESAQSLKSSGLAAEPGAADANGVSVQATAPPQPAAMTAADTAPAAIAPEAPAAARAAVTATPEIAEAVQKSLVPGQFFPGTPGLVADPSPAVEATVAPVAVAPVAEGVAPPAEPESGEPAADAEIFATEASPGPDGGAQSTQAIDGGASPNSAEVSATEGAALPLWQIEVALAGASALLIGLWAFLRRRAAS